jgi:hypothetical protein
VIFTTVNSLKAKHQGSEGIKLQAEVGESFLKQPSTEMVNGLTYNGRMPDVQMSFLHFLELLHENVVHYHWQIASVVALAILIA